MKSEVRRKPIFEYIPVESQIEEFRNEYYDVIAKCHVACCGACAMNTAVLLGAQLKGAPVGNDKFSAVSGNVVVHTHFLCYGNWLEI